MRLMIIGPSLHFAALAAFQAQLLDEGYVISIEKMERPILPDNVFTIAEDSVKKIREGLDCRPPCMPTPKEERRALDPFYRGLRKYRKY